MFNLIEKTNNKKNSPSQIIRRWERWLVALSYCRRCISADQAARRLTGLRGRRFDSNLSRWSDTNASSPRPHMADQDFASQPRLRRLLALLRPFYDTSIPHRLHFATNQARRGSLSNKIDVTVGLELRVDSGDSKLIWVGWGVGGSYWWPPTKL
jgi:hypothetical protein